jgi:Tfp pilus assembly protein PilN
MVRVNLLPREVIDRRRFEQWYRYVFIGVVGGVLIVLFAYAGILLITQQKNDDLQVLQEQAKQYQSQADAFGVFEVKEQELTARKQVAQTALAGRINMGMLAEEVSLVLPDEVWLSNLTLSEETGILLQGQTPHSASESVDIGFKSVAKLLVRLNELKNVYDVWLSSATTSDWTGWATAPGDAKPKPASVVGFQATAKIQIPTAAPAAASTSTVPAPPAGN